ncbi:hypothetical protein NT017_12540 [Prolixibacter sp. NT017]|nr:hypothetical protein NT017_12540 [Prolixibacter sp. NT017]
MTSPKSAFYFAEKTKPDVMELDIDNTIKSEFDQRELTGKLIPLVINVTGKEQLKDVLTIVEYKKRLK